MVVLAEKNENPELPVEKVSCTGRGFSDQRGCGRLLEINPLDVFSSTSHDYTGGTDTYYYVTCPVCNCRTEVFTSEFTSAFKAMAKMYG